MSNPYAALDLSDDENITVVKPAAEPAKAEKKHVVVKRHMDITPPARRQDILAAEASAKQPKKGPAGPRGQQPQPDVAHPGERSKIGLKKEAHVDTHKPADGEKRRGREFERHSGTGRGREIKKGGAGGHNWGKAGEENPAPAATPEPGAAAEAKEEEPAAPEEDPALTLDEYEKLKAAQRSGAAFAPKEARKVTAAVSGTVYKKDEDEGEGVYIKLGAEANQKSKPAHFKSKPAKQAFEIDLKFKDNSAPSRDREDRPSRGRPDFAPRGGASRSAPRSSEDGPRPARGTGGAPRGRGAPRGGAAAASTGGSGRLDTADQSAFPKLGGA